MRLAASSSDCRTSAALRRQRTLSRLRVAPKRSTRSSRTSGTSGLLILIRYCIRRGISGMPSLLPRDHSVVRAVSRVWLRSSRCPRSPRTPSMTCYRRGRNLWPPSRAGVRRASGPANCCPKSSRYSHSWTRCARRASGQKTSCRTRRPYSGYWLTGHRIGSVLGPLFLRLAPWSANWVFVPLMRSA